MKRHQAFSHVRALGVLLVTSILSMGILAGGAEYFVSPTGSDTTGNGSINLPYKTIGKAVQMVSAGGTIYLRAGQHDYISTISLSKNGTSVLPITLQGYQDEDVVLDFTGQPTSSGSRGVDIGGSYWHLNNFTVQYAGDNGVYVDGAHNTVERIVSRWNEDSGIQLHTGAAYNLVLNCDSYENYDLNNEKRGENADGFAAKFGLGLGNVIRGCRSWGNSDDGFDCWNQNVGEVNGVTMEYCVAFRNGIDLWGGATPFDGDGNGFKLGQSYGAHVLTNCIAYNNPHHGIDLNGNTTGVTIYNCTCVGNSGLNFRFNINSSVHVLRNNLSHNGLVTIYDQIDDAYNSWNGFTVSSADFVSLDPSAFEGPRQANGDLPKASYLRLAATTGLIDAGTNVGLEFEGAAPDLGAFEWLAGDCCQSDGDVDLDDVLCFAAAWLQAGCGLCSGADFDASGRVNIVDFAMLAENWM
ncbi:MAG: right-handed parallel beta-helix repeat-containing protein [Planctomycetaceae bacterium]|nr:right-handed parallel beta-helix repeat-containing protein [Planctomycetaceae bacterium]